MAHYVVEIEEPFAGWIVDNLKLCCLRLIIGAIEIVVVFGIIFRRLQINVAERVDGVLYIICFMKNASVFIFLFLFVPAFAIDEVPQ